MLDYVTNIIFKNLSIRCTIQTEQVLETRIIKNNEVFIITKDIFCPINPVNNAGNLLIDSINSIFKINL